MGKDAIDLRSMLPAQAKQALYDWCLKQMEASRLNGYLNPTFNVTDALRAVESDDWARSIAAECYDKALKEYERRHPVYSDAGMFKRR